MSRAEFSRKLGYAETYIKYRISEIKSGKINIENSKTLFSRILTKIHERYAQDLSTYWDVILEFYQNCYQRAFLDVPTINFESIKNHKRELIDDIIIIINEIFPRIKIFDIDVSRILSDNNKNWIKDYFIKNIRIDKRPESSTLISAIYHLRNLDINKLIERIKNITFANECQLSNLKQTIESKLIEFIFHNKYKVKHIDDSHPSGTDYFRPEFELTLEISIIVSLAKKKFNEIKKVRRFLKFEGFGYLTKVRQHSWESLLMILNNLRDLIPVHLYRKAFETVWKYIETRDIQPILPSEYHPNWDDEDMKKFHIIITLIRDLGLGILNLEPLPTESFKKLSYNEWFTFIRHHIYLNDKYSIDVNRIVLIILSWHALHEQKTNIILNLMKDRCNLVLECPKYYKENVEDWKVNWQEYLKRRNYLIEYGIENFIRKYFTDKNGNNYLINRFFKNATFGHIEQEIIFLMQKWIEKNRPAPILNTYILNRLFFGTPNLLTSGYIENKF
ncbi:MAG: hypothetical protein V3V33_10785 [Candidatus Lokiarchaeia archaeon]